MRTMTEPVATSNTTKRSEEQKIRLTPAEKSELKRRAQDHGYAQLAEFIRACALSAQVAHDMRLARDIARVGELLNALLLYAQGTDSPIPRDRIERLLDTAEQLFQAHLPAGSERG
ncbi:plasmid mobilization protein [Rhodovulum adriaticum]|uniref:Uncharacterized protein n=1 Tax=Rhodovulum adriaticum TaxID=35804 RepID=A0A4R2NWS2_RHOAD|nr:hypothetical protein [Rhodovulum adriaticum]MBK1634345.1 hypothetical protein [Rhodovulum adriaticum]TCP26051.1 hypothetical protein EV656_10212 [Rhodovulum adriaticum]